MMTVKIETKIFLDGREESEIGRMWQIYTDINCLVCGKTQSYSVYDNACLLCGYAEEPPIFVFENNFPVVFSSNEEVEKVRERIDSIVVASQMLDYEKPTYKWTRNYLRINILSRQKDSRIQLHFHFDKFANYKKASIRVGNYLSIDGTREVASDENVFKIFNELEKVI